MKGESTVEADEAIRPETTLETLAKLKGIGGEDATHTAGNAPGVNDGAAAVVVASAEWAERARGEAGTEKAPARAVENNRERQVPGLCELGDF